MGVTSPPSGIRIWVVHEGAAADAHLVETLKRHRFLVETIATDVLLRALRNRRAHGAAAGEKPALIVLDRLDASRGLELHQHLRRRLGLPVLLIVDREDAAMWGRQDDGVLVAPFSTRRLLHRIRAMVAAGPKEIVEEEIIEVGPFRLNTLRRVLQRGDAIYCLTPKQCRLLAILMRRAGRVVPRRDLIRWVWGAETPVRSRTLDVHIRWLRRILEEDPAHPRYLETVRHVGYRFSASGGKPDPDPRGAKGMAM